jgi:N-carbamoyl-L-amino-acid hydrolase
VLLFLDFVRPKRLLPSCALTRIVFRETLENLSVYGRPRGGTFADGVSRVAFSDADLAGRKYAMQLMASFGMEPRIDPAGNIFGSREGSNQNLKPILFGSHIDSVSSGGNFDGDLGCLATIKLPG